MTKKRTVKENRELFLQLKRLVRKEKKSITSASLEIGVDVNRLRVLFREEMMKLGAFSKRNNNRPSKKWQKINMAHRYYIMNQGIGEIADHYGVSYRHTAVLISQMKRYFKPWIVALLVQSNEKIETALGHKSEPYFPHEFQMDFIPATYETLSQDEQKIYLKG